LLSRRTGSPEPKAHPITRFVQQRSRVMTKSQVDIRLKKMQARQNARSIVTY
jgi:hypothetical protein